VGACRTTERYVTRQQETLKRLARHAPGVGIEQRDGTIWLSVDGFAAPVIVGHGFISIRARYGGDPVRSRTLIDLPARLRRGREDPGPVLARLVRESHTAFATYARAVRKREEFRATLAGVAHVAEVYPNDVASITLRLDCTLAQAADLAALIKTWRR
jgi:hypothetical protein